MPEAVPLPRDLNQRVRLIERVAALALRLVAVVMPGALRAISHVRFPVTDIEVSRVDAFRRVAAMAGKLTSPQGFASQMAEYPPMRQSCAFGYSEAAVSGRIASACPWVAGVRAAGLVGVVAKPLQVGNSVKSLPALGRYCVG